MYAINIFGMQFLVQLPNDSENPGLVGTQQCSSNIALIVHFACNIMDCLARFQGYPLVVAQRQRNGRDRHTSFLGNVTHSYFAHARTSFKVTVCLMKGQAISILIKTGVPRSQ
ncbi:hypothetical protein AN946_03555 [Trueperella pyogenes]|nr:hypothetical protein AN946_03555 [Trueperella pyogenes]